MSEVPKNVLTSLTLSLNNTIHSARLLDGVYQKELGRAFNILDSCYQIPADLQAITQFQVNTLRQVLDNSFSIKQTEGFNKEIDDTENQVYNIFREFDRYKKMYSEISANILEKLSSIQEIHEIIEKMKNISREIKLFSINSVIVASQAGSQGVAFKSISRFIIELSDSIQKAASQLEIYRDKILSTHKKVDQLFNKLITEIYEVQAVSLKKEVLESIKKTKSHFTFISIITDDIDKRILQSLQEGQVLERQFKPGTRQLPLVAYWINGLTALSSAPEKNIAEDGTEDILNTISYSFHILNNMAKKMSGHEEVLNGFINRTKSMYDNLVTKFGSTQQDSMYIFNYFAVPTEKTDSLLDRIFAEFKDGLKNLRALLKEEANVKSELTEVFEDMQKIHNEGLSFFASFEKFFVIMNNINILAQIEMSKRDFDGGNNVGLKMKFLNMLEQLKFFNEDIKNRIQKMLVSLMSQMNNFTETQLEQSIFLLNTNSFLDTQGDRIDYLKKQTLDIVNSVRDENSKIFSVEMAAKKFLDGFESQAANVKRLTADLYSDVLMHQGKFNGLLNYYNISLRDYTVNNTFIQNYERTQIKV